MCDSKAADGQTTLFSAVTFSMICQFALAISPLHFMHVWLLVAFTF
jgi:hypothetical protein